MGMPMRTVAMVVDAVIMIVDRMAVIVAVQGLARSIGSRSRFSLLQRWRDKSRRFAIEQWFRFPNLRDRSELAAAFDDNASKRFEDHLLTC